MALRDELLGIRGIGPALADKIIKVTNKPGNVVEFKSTEPAPDPMYPALVSALRAAKTGCNPPNGCPLCGVDGCHERCPAWGV